MSKITYYVHQSKGVGGERGYIAFDANLVGVRVFVCICVCVASCLSSI